MNYDRIGRIVAGQSPFETPRVIIRKVPWVKRTQRERAALK